ncbi:MAG: hypothetical protein ACPGVU_12895 [Limisphaerales bacterium]
MEFLKKLLKPKPKPKREAAKIDRLPNGSFTVDSNCKILTSTLPQSFPVAVVEDIGQAVVEAFREGQGAGLPLTELQFHFGSLKITAREQRGGAMIFLAPIR